MKKIKSKFGVKTLINSFKRSKYQKYTYEDPINFEAWILLRELREKEKQKQKFKVEFYTTKHQIDLLPRVIITHSKKLNSYYSLEFFWIKFGIALMFK